MALSHIRLATIDRGQGGRAAVIVNHNGRDMAVDVANATGRDSDCSVMGLLADWDAALARIDLAASKAAGLGVPLAQVRLLAPIPTPGTIFCAGSNYSDHALEMARASGRDAPDDPKAIGLRSWHFIKAGQAVTGPGTTVHLPPKSKKVDWEAELALVIGRPAKNVAEADALNYVAGYFCANDLSARDFGRRPHLPDDSSFKADWIAHKSFDGSCPTGPWITLARDVPDPHNLAIDLDVNGVNKQHSNSGYMIFNINDQIADLSGRMTLRPGDIILTGTPAGVGNGRGEFLKAGDVVSVRIGHLGELVNTMA